MTTYRQIGSAPAMERLRTQLEAQGARLTDVVQSDLTLVAASTTCEAVSALDELDDDERARTVVVGIDDPLDIRDRPVAGTLAQLLETYQPLGVLRAHVIGGWDSTGFIGSKELASKLGAKYLNLYSSRTYASWMDCEGEDAADFLLRVVAASKR